MIFRPRSVSSPVAWSMSSALFWFPRKNPGASAFTRIPWGANSLAVAMVRLWTAALAASYAQTPDSGTKEDMEARLMMQPRGFRSIQRAADDLGGHHETRHEVEAEHVLELLHVSLEEARFPPVAAGAVDEDVDGAEPLFGLLQRGANEASSAASASSGERAPRLPPAPASGRSRSPLSFRWAQRLTLPPALRRASAMAPAMTPPAPVMAMVFPASPNISSA